MADLEQFAEDLHQEVLGKCNDTTSPQLREDAFTESVLGRLEDHNQSDGVEYLPCLRWGSRGPAPAAKINAWALSGDGATLDLFVALYHGTGKPVPIAKPDVAKHFALARGFLQRSLDGFHTKLEEAHEVFEVARRIHESRDCLATVRLFLITDGTVASRAADVDEPQLPGIDLRYVLWDLEKLSQLLIGEREEISLDLAGEYGGSLPCVCAADASGEYTTYLGFLSGSILAKAYGTYGQRLLEKNVRAFLQAKNKVNKGIQQTLRDSPHRFLAYNNGLCCTASKVDVVAVDKGHVLLNRVTDFQIVNGGQTTASIFHAWKKERTDISSVVVQIKLTVLNDVTELSELVPLVSRFANSQNKVNAADFSANGKFHQDLEALSRTVWCMPKSGLDRGTHWYYERARGSYLDDKGRQGIPSHQKTWASQNPPFQKFTKTDLAKYEHAWLGLPHLVCRGAEKNFVAFAERLEDDRHPVVDRPFFENVVARAVMWRCAEKLFDSLSLDGYRANSVAYGVALISESSGRRLDLARIWREQCLPNEVSTALLAACRLAHEFLTNLPGNIGEASKKPETWAAFRQANPDLPGSWKNHVSEAECAPYLEKSVDPAVETARQDVCSLTAKHWFALSKWAKERTFLEGWERSIAFSIGRRLANGTLPSDKQSMQGSRILARARELGFAPVE